MHEVLALVCLTIIAVVAMVTSKDMLKDQFGDNKDEKKGKKEK